MPEVLLTIGYQKRSIDEFVALALAAGVDVLVDVRETAWSHKPGFSKTSFAIALEAAGIEYVHAAFAGNPKFLRDSAQNHADCLSLYAWYLDEHTEVVDTFEDLVASIFRDGKRAALTCFERHSDDCHRSILAERWAARAKGEREVTHLAIDGCQRLLAN